MYKSYLILVNDYLCSLQRNIIFDIIIPFFISIVGFFLLVYEIIIIDKSFITNILSVLGILAGFSITAVTILTSIDNNSVNELKKSMTDIYIDGVQISLFRRLYILISYSILISLILIIFNTIGYTIPLAKIFPKLFICFLKSFDMFFILHVFFLNIRNITSLYFLYFKETNIEK